MTLLIEVTSVVMKYVIYIYIYIYIYIKEEKREIKKQQQDEHLYM